MNKQLIAALVELEREKGIKVDTIIEALEIALAAAYKRKYRVEHECRTSIDTTSGEIKVFKILEEEGGEERQEEISEVEVTPDNFGRIAAQTAKQVIGQRIKEAEREIMYDEFKDRVGDLVTGIVQQSDSRFTLVDLGRVEALLPPYEQVHGERYRHGERIKCYISDVRKTSKGPQVIVSRTHTGLIRRLFELEVPEIHEEIVEIMSIAREAGFRTKIAVKSNEKNVDPVGACVGPKGSRVRMIVDELGGEKIDIVDYNEDMMTYIKNSLSPARVNKVLIDDENKFALIVVSSDQLSLAIGREGQNARLAARLTGWKVDIKSDKQFEEELAEAREERIMSNKEESGSEEKIEEPGKKESVEPVKKKAAPAKKKKEAGSEKKKSKPAKKKKEVASKKKKSKPAKKKKEVASKKKKAAPAKKKK
ncbi:MAG: transcription termination factor NusA [Actinomycetia bacterium]|nr:transcription termination factor NusA [Actinomycetes bacterium]